MMEVIHSSEMSVLTRVTQHNIPEDGILHSHHYENLKSYMSLERFSNHLGPTGAGDLSTRKPFPTAEYLWE
jgi:hypothetical protein